MPRLIFHRLGSMLPTLVIISMAVFALSTLLPGDPAVAIAGESATPERLADIRHALGLSNPLWRQYWDWVTPAITGDFGTSLVSGEDIGSAVVRRLLVTLQLVGLAIVFSVLAGLPLGVAAARRAGSRIDSAVTMVATLGLAMPAFWFGMIAALFFAIKLEWFPATGFSTFGESGLGTLSYSVLPAVALGLSGMAEVARQVRSAMVEVLQAPFVRSARASGLAERTVVWRHALKNAGVPALTVVGLLVNRLIGTAVVVEAVFGIPGVGQLILQAVIQKDVRMLQAAVLAVAVVVLVTNLVVDVLSVWLNPRLKAV
jgi:peptide/nickel transport system permease protein